MREKKRKRCRCTWSARARDAPDEATLVARRTRLEPTLLRVHLARTGTFPTQQEPVIVAHVASAQMRICCGQTFEELPELAILVQPPHLLGPTHVPSVDEHTRESQTRFATRDPTELREKTRVHRNVALVQSDAESAQDGTHRFAVLERAADHAEAREVHHNALLRAGDGRQGLRLGGAWGVLGGACGKFGVI